MRPTVRYAVELIATSAGIALLLLVPNVLARQILVSIAGGIAVIAWLVELLLVLIRRAPATPIAVVLLVLLSIVTSTLPHLALATGKNPEDNYTAIAHTDSPYARWLRLLVMQINLIGPGGYLRYFPVSYTAQMISTGVLLGQFFAKVLVVATVVQQCVRRHKRVRMVQPSPPGPGLWHRFFIYNILLIFIAALLVGLIGDVAFITFTPWVIIANGVMLIELGLAVHRLFDDDHDHEPPSIPQLAAHILFIMQVCWATFTLTTVFDPASAWSNLVTGSVASNSYFRIWLRMLYVVIEALGPGGTGLIVPTALWIEVIVSYVIVVWIFALLLIINVAVGLATRRRVRVFEI